MSSAFLLDFEEHWPEHGKGVLDILAVHQPAAYFAGAVALAKVVSSGAYFSRRADIDARK